MKYRYIHTKTLARKAAASICAFAVLFSSQAGVMNSAAQTVPYANSTEQTSAAPDSEAVLTVYNNTRDMDITEQPNIYLDNTDLGGGMTMNSVTVRLTDKNGSPITDKDAIAYEVSEPNSSLIVKEVPNPDGSAGITLELYSVDASSSEEAPLSPGTVTITFSNKEGTATTTLRCSVFSPANDMTIFWDSDSEPLPLNDFCETNEAEVNAVENHSYNLTAQVLPSNSSDNVTWAVWDGIYTGAAGESPKTTDKASINSDGVFTANKAGTVTIVAKFAATGSSPRLYSYGEKELYTAGGATSTANVKTVPKYIHVTIDKENPAAAIAFGEGVPDALEEGQIADFITDVTPTFTGDGYTGATDYLRYDSSDPSVAAIDANGVVTAVSKGDATITVHGENPNVYAEKKIRVIRKVTAITLTPSPAQTRTDVPLSMTAALSPTDAYDEIEWSISDSSFCDPEPVKTGEFSSDQSCFFTPTKEGTFTVTVTAVNSGVSASAEVTVLAAGENDGLTLTYKTAEGDIPVVDDTAFDIYTNQNIEITAALSETAAVTQGDTIKWVIGSNENDCVTIAKRTTNSLVLHGSSEGTVSVTAYAKSNEKVSRTFSVRVLRACETMKFLDSDGNDYPSSKSVNVGALIKLYPDLKISGNYPYAHSDRVVGYKSSDTAIAQVDEYGNVRAISNGNAIITATAASGKTASCAVSVFTTSQVILNNVKVSSYGGLPTASINLNNNMQGSTTLGVTIKDQNGAAVKNADTVWTSSDESVALVDNSGHVTAVSLGRATISVRSGSKTDQCILTVCASVKLASIDTVATQVFSPLKQYYEPKPAVVYNGTTLTEGIDYSITYENNTGIGKATMTITGERFYTDSRAMTFSIQGKQLTDPEIATSEIEDQICTGKDITPVPVVMCSGVMLHEGSDFVCTYANNKMPGTATLTIRGEGNYIGTIKKVFTIYCAHEDTTAPITVREATCSQAGLKTATCNICGEDIEIEIEKLPHTYAEKVVEPTMSEQGYTLHYCTVCGEGYKDSYTEKLPGIDILDCVATINGSVFAYTGQPIKPTVTLTYKDKPLTENADFIVSYLDNIEKGKAYAVITGIGIYEGTGKITFTIADTGDSADTDSKAELVTTDSDVDTDDGRINITQKEVITLDPVYYSPDETPFTPKPVVSIGKNALVEDVDFTIAYANNTDVGTASVVMQGIGRYKGIARFEFEILPKPLTDADVVVRQIGTQKCTGKALTPSPIVVCGVSYLKNRRDYRVNYTSNITPGIATATITGIGNYTGRLTVTFRIECDHNYSEQVVAPTYTARGYTLHTCSICGETFRDNYTDQLRSKDLKYCDIFLEYDSISYTGDQRTPTVTINYNDTTLELGTHYTVEYSNNVQVGIANVTIKGIGAYSGTVIKNFQIFVGIMGDINFDGVITSDDALLCLRSTVGLYELTPSQHAVSDVNADGQITSDDCLIILRYTVNLMTEGAVIGVEASASSAERLA